MFLLQLQALSHVCMCKKAEAKEKVEKKQRFKGYSGKGAKLKSAIQNPSLVDPKHSSLFFFGEGQLCSTFTGFRGWYLEHNLKILTSFTQDAAGGNIFFFAAQET